MEREVYRSEIGKLVVDKNKYRFFVKNKASLVLVNAVLKKNHLVPEEVEVIYE